MIRPDYRQIKQSNEIYHYGMPRRSGRYPYGSGKRPYQGDDVKKSIEDVANKNKEISREQNKQLAARKIGEQIRYKNDNSSDFKESFDRLSEKSKKINNKVDDIMITLYKETQQAAKNPKFKKEVYDKANKNQSSDPFEFKLEEAIRDNINSPKYTPSSSKKRSQLEKDLDDYDKSLINEVDRLIGGDIGEMKIPKTKSNVTYGEALEKALSFQNKHSWKLRIFEEMESGIEDIFLSYMDEYDMNQ